MVDRKRRWLSWAIALVVCGGWLPSGATPALAQAEADGGPSPEARAANEEALRLSGEGDYAGALELFQKAYDLSPSYVILYNIGRMSRLTGDEKRAIEAFSRYLEEGGDEVEPARRAEVEQEIASLQKLVGSLDIQVNVEGATVTVDDVIVGKSPLSEPIIVNAGKHRVRATKQGASSAEQEFDVKRGATLAVELSLDEEEVTTPGPDEPFELPGAGASSTLVWPLWIGTAVLAVGAGATGTIALIESGNLEDARYAGQPGYGPPRDSNIVAQRDRIHALAVTTNWLIAGAVVAGTAALYFTIAGATENEPGAEVGVGPNGIQLSGSF